MSGRQAHSMASPRPAWEASWNWLLTLAPWVLLAIPVAISQVLTPQDWGQRGLTLALAAVAACWVYLGHTRTSAQQRERPLPMLVYFAGLLAVAAALMQRDQIFLLFAITGFFHAFHLRPVPLGVGGVFATSLLLNTSSVLNVSDITAQDVGTYIAVVLIQTGAISVGIVFGAVGTKMDRKREETMVKLEEALEENAGLHAQLLTQAREAGALDERQRMAREIHDTLAQGLTGIITQVQAAQRIWQDPQQSRPHLDRALALAKDSLAEARRSVEALRPQDLAEAHLPDALDTLVRRWATENDVRATVEVTGERVPLSPAIEVALYRMAQEALTNVAKHAEASRVGVTLSYLDDVVLLDVRDDGRGMESARGTGFGINSMTQRIRGVGGQRGGREHSGRGHRGECQRARDHGGSLPRPVALHRS
ncbi:signal transduction histidine kinase [Lipingzhangella halophila]|uniref:Signal transduction histidine kinase n=1 Tax=Lipingzhangella halophila TaxID=1783352 RepID=A0A7W7RJI5_9ACTN|nr:sensor histidine kinase [Lipingzhangella halophila]MBB4932621.1 signal transduction histidine kinase [Lipingzhangella halophila]